jgi:hypothetical protein
MTPPKLRTAIYARVSTLDQDPAMHPHSFPPYLPILGTRIISPPSALSQACSPPHRRHSVLPIFGTLPSPAIGTYGAMVYPRIVSTDVNDFMCKI